MGTRRPKNARQIAASSLPPIPSEHVRLTHNFGNPSLIHALQHGEGFRFRHENIGLTTDAFSTNDRVADWVSSGARNWAGPLTLLMDLPFEEHNKRLGRFGWKGYEPVPNQNVVGHIDENGLFVPLQRIENPPAWDSIKLLDESPVSPYRKSSGIQVSRPALPPALPGDGEAGRRPGILYELLDPRDIW